jgi:hypothetical protein
MKVDTIAGKYRHYRTNNPYEVIGVATHSETREKLVVYRALYHSEEYGENSLWVRPESMFFEMVRHGDVLVPRFKKVDE